MKGERRGKIQKNLIKLREKFSEIFREVLKGYFTEIMETLWKKFGKNLESSEKFYEIFKKILEKSFVLEIKNFFLNKETEEKFLGLFKILLLISQKICTFFWKI